MTAKEIFPLEDGWPEDGTILILHEYDGRVCCTDIAVRDGVFYRYTKRDTYEVYDIQDVDCFGFSSGEKVVFIHNTYDGVFKKYALNFIDNR